MKASSHRSTENIIDASAYVVDDVTSQRLFRSLVPIPVPRRHLGALRVRLSAGLVLGQQSGSVACKVIDPFALG